MEAVCIALQSAMRVAKQVNSSSSSNGYHIFMHVARKIPDESSKDIVQHEFDVLCGMKCLDTIFHRIYILILMIGTQETRKIQTLTDWWRAPHILQKLSKAIQLT